MSLGTFINQPCTIVTRTADTADTYGDITKTETSTASLCELQPSGSSSSPSESEVEGGNIGVTKWRLYLEGGVSLNSDDAIVIDGETYELVGDAEVRRNSRTGLDEYTVAHVRRVRDV